MRPPRETFSTSPPNRCERWRPDHRLRSDRRSALYEYAGTRDTLVAFLGDGPVDVLEVGCGTGHWLNGLASRCRRTVGLEPSMPMLRVASRRLGAARRGLVRAVAERLPFA